MITLPLTVRHAGQALHATAAWHIASGDPRVWLDELARWGVPLAAAKVYVLPGSAGERAASGALVILPTEARPREILRAEPYGCIERRLYLPAAAKLCPELTPAELAALLPYDVNVFHPALGLIGFKPSDALAVADLLAPPAQSTTAWKLPLPSAALYPRLVSVEPDIQISLDQIFESEARDIGIEPPENLPVTDAEQQQREQQAAREGWRKAARLGSACVLGAGAVMLLSGIGGGIAGGGLLGAALLLVALSALAAGSAAAKDRAQANDSSAKDAGSKRGSSWGDAFNAWARSIFSPRNPELENKREKEIDRLLKMLDTDPDRALRYALPFGGAGRRGTLQGGARLAQHSTDFNLQNLRGGGAAAHWDIGLDAREQLRRKYIEAANRELSLGRYRRAAYIFAELLNDHASAAAALKQGRHFREAAVIYRDMLHNKVMAAECLEEGGLLLEAIELRVQLSQWIEVGRLYEKLERSDDARRAYRQAADAEREQQNFIGCAAILRQRLHDDEAALEVLAAGWPGSTQAAQCLEESFHVLGALGRHKSAERKIDALRGELTVDANGRQAVEILARVSASYPDTTLRAKAADSARVIAGGWLPHVPLEQARALAHAVSTLAPHDRLLARDTGRFIDARRAAERATQPVPVKPPPKKPRLLRTLRLPLLKWHTAASAGGEFFYAGGVTASNEAALLRGSWDNRIQYVLRKVVNLHQRWLVLEPPRNPAQPVLACLSGARIPMFAWTKTFELPHEESCGTPSWMPPGACGFCYDEHGSVYLAAQQDGRATLLLHTPQGELLAQTHLGNLAAERRHWLPMAARSEFVFVTDGAATLMLFFRGRVSQIPFSSEIGALAVSSPFTRLRVAAALKNGGVLLWPSALVPAAQIAFGEGLPDPKIAFTRGGALIAAAQEELRVYSTENQTLKLQASMGPLPAVPMAVTPAAGLNDFAVFFQNGAVQIYQAP